MAIFSIFSVQLPTFLEDAKNKNVCSIVGKGYIDSIEKERACWKTKVETHWPTVLNVIRVQVVIGLKQLHYTILSQRTNSRAYIPILCLHRCKSQPKRTNSKAYVVANLNQLH